MARDHHPNKGGNTRKMQEVSAAWQAYLAAYQAAAKNAAAAKAAKNAAAAKAAKNAAAAKAAKNAAAKNAAATDQALRQAYEAAKAEANAKKAAEKAAARKKAEIDKQRLKNLFRDTVKLPQVAYAQRLVLGGSEAQAKKDADAALKKARATFEQAMNNIYGKTRKPFISRMTSFFKRN